MITKDVSTLNVHKLTNEQYERLLRSGDIDEYALYLTPDDNYTRSQIDTMLNNRIPECSTLNEGQFLRVVNGVAAWCTMSRAEDHSF